MIKQAIPVEFVYQAFALILSVIIVHGIYVSIIWPRADAILAEQKALIQADKDAEIERSVFVIVRDREQEVCFILMLWAFAIMAYKGVIALRERRLLDEDLVPIPEGTKVLPDDTKRLSRKVQALPRQLRNLLLPRALLLGQCLHLA